MLCDGFWYDIKYQYAGGRRHVKKNDKFIARLQQDFHILCSNYLVLSLSLSEQFSEVNISAMFMWITSSWYIYRSILNKSIP